LTRPTQKIRERFLAEQAARFLSVIWSLSQDRERPDFIINEGAQQFGLEVSEIFAGHQGRAGSILKKKESKTQRTLEALRREYEATNDVPWRVQFVGDMSGENMTRIVPALLAIDFPSKRVGHHDVIDKITAFEFM
jgi:hypothetical protein